MLRRCGALLASSLLFACARSETRSTPPAAIQNAPHSAATANADAIASASVALSAAPPPDLDALPWTSVGDGVSAKDTQNQGENVFVAFAGWHVSLASAQKWASALHRASLARRGVRWIFAARGPADPMYRGREIANAKLAAAMVPLVTEKTKFVLVVAHSSGAYVANDLFARLTHGADPTDATRERVVYFDLDGGDLGLDAAIVDRLRRAYFVGAFDPITATASHEDDDMRAAGATYGSAGGYVRHDANGSGCKKGATWCVHMTLVTTHPHDPSDAKEIDFADFEGRDVARAWLEAKANDAGLE